MTPLHGPHVKRSGPQMKRSSQPTRPESLNLMNAHALPPRKRIVFSTFIRKVLKQRNPLYPVNPVSIKFTSNKVLLLLRSYYYLIFLRIEYLGNSALTFLNFFNILHTAQTISCARLVPAF